MRIQSTQPQTRQTTQANRQAKPNFGNLSIKIKDPLNVPTNIEKFDTNLTRKVQTFVNSAGYKLTEGLDEWSVHTLFVPMPMKDPKKALIEGILNKFFPKRFNIEDCENKALKTAEEKLASALQD